jgi:hypothetical protein
VGGILRRGIEAARTPRLRRCQAASSRSRSRQGDHEAGGWLASASSRNRSHGAGLTQDESDRAGGRYSWGRSPSASSSVAPGRASCFCISMNRRAIDAMRGGRPLPRPPGCRSRTFWACWPPTRRACRTGPSRDDTCRLPHQSSSRQVPRLGLEHIWAVAGRVRWVLR